MADDAPSESFIETVIRQVVTKGFVIGLFPKPIREFFREPENKVREWVLNILLAFVANIVFTTTELIDQGVNAVIAPFTTVRISLTDTIGTVASAVTDPVITLNTFLADTIASGLGVGAFPFLVALYVAEIALLIRVGRAAIPALSDAAGAIPVLGSFIDAAVTFAYRLVGGAR